MVGRMTAERKVAGSDPVSDGFQPAPYLVAVVGFVHFVGTWGGILRKE